jgi:hypothetical protein
MPRITIPSRTNREIARGALADANSAPEVDENTMLIVLLGIGYALLEIADAARERNYALSEALKESCDHDHG